MFIDAATMLLLSGAAPQPAMHQRTVMHAAMGDYQRVNHLPAALLMSPLPVLTAMWRQTLEQSAQAAAAGANSLLDLAQEEDVMMGDISSEEAGIGNTAMVGAAAAALALLNLAQARNAPRY